jgi:hypothetical protein
MGVDLGEREVPVHEAEVIGEITPRCFDDGMCPCGMRTLEVAILHEHDRCIAAASDMVPVVDRYCEMCGLHEGSLAGSPADAHRKARRHVRSDSGASGRASDVGQP